MEDYFLKMSIYESQDAQQITSGNQVRLLVEELCTTHHVARQISRQTQQPKTILHSAEVSPIRAIIWLTVKSNPEFILWI